MSNDSDDLERSLRRIRRVSWIVASLFVAIALIIAGLIAWSMASAP